MFYRYYTYTKVKDILRTFEPDNHKMLRTSQPQNFFAGPYKKKVYSLRGSVIGDFFDNKTFPNIKARVNPQ